MKVFKEDSEFEKKLQQVENLMRDLGISIEVVPGGLGVTFQGKNTTPIETHVMDIESWTLTSSLPRGFESERLVNVDSY